MSFLHQEKRKGTNRNRNDNHCNNGGGTKGRDVNVNTFIVVRNPDPTLWYREYIDKKKESRP